MVVEQAKRFHRVEVVPPNRLVVSFKPAYALAKSTCERPEQVTRFEQAPGGSDRPAGGGRIHPVGGVRRGGGPGQAAVPPHQRLLEAAKHPLVRRAGELFGAQPLRVEEKEQG